MAAAALFCSSAFLSAVHAEEIGTNVDSDEVASADQAPIAMTAARGSIVVMAFLDVNLSKDRAFEPISVAPDIWYGATDKITVGLTHSSVATGGFWGGPGTGLCLSGEEKGCANTYSNTGLQARYDLSDSVSGLALEGGILLRDLDPFVMSGKIGAVFSKQVSSFQLLLAPNFQLGFTERDAGNKEVLNIPVSLLYPLSDTLGLGVQSGVSLPLSDTGDLWRLPLSLVGQTLVSEKYYVYGAFTLGALAGGELLETGADARALTLGAGATL